VIVPALTFVATWNAVLAAGLVPVPVDIKPDTLGIDENLIEKAITKKTYAIMPVSLMGKPYKADVIRDIANKHGLLVLGDHCESHLARYKGKLLDNYTDMSAYSFYSAHLSFSVEQGAVVTNDHSVRNMIWSVRSHGRPPQSLDFKFDRFGLNLKPTDLHAAVGLGNLETIKDDFNTRKNVWYTLDALCKQYKEMLYLVEEEEGETICPHAYSITFKCPSVCKVFKEHLDKAGIQYKTNFGAITQHDAFNHLGYSVGDFKNAEFSGENGVHVPTHQYLTVEDVHYLVKVINDFMEQLRMDLY
jgi:dTDP-4-amino-4,6-dideoxygalactose transaminase